MEEFKLRYIKVVNYKEGISLKNNNEER